MFPLDPVYPLTVLVLDGYKDGYLVRMSEFRYLKPYFS